MSHQPSVQQQYSNNYGTNLGHSGIMPSNPLNNLGNLSIPPNTQIQSSTQIPQSSQTSHQTQGSFYPNQQPMIQQPQQYHQQQATGPNNIYVPTAPQMTQQQQTVVPSNSTNSTELVETKRNYDIVNMIPLKMEFKDAFCDEFKNSLVEDFEKVKNMNLLTEDMKFTLLTLSPAMKHNKKYLFVKVISYYKKLYEPLFSKYDSLGTWAETVLGMIIYQGFKKFQDFCTNLYKNVPRIEKPDTKSDDVPILSRRSKRKVDVNETKGSKKPKVEFDSNGKVHPFLQTDAYMNNPLIFELGKLVQWCIPTQFAAIGASIYYTEVVKIGSLNSRTTFKGIKIEFAKPTIGILGARTDSDGNTFSRVEDYSSLKTILQQMTGLRTGEECFSYGHKKQLSCYNIATGSLKKLDGYEEGYNMILIGEYSGFQLFNNMISCKGYTEIVYHYDKGYNEVSTSDKKNCEELNKQKEREFKAAMNDYDPIDEEEDEEDFDYLKNEE